MYDLETRRKVVDAYKAGEGSIKLVAQKYGVSHSTLEQWLRYDREKNGDLSLNQSEIP